MRDSVDVERNFDDLFMLVCGGKHVSEASDGGMDVRNLWAFNRRHTTGQGANVCQEK